MSKDTSLQGSGQPSNAKPSAPTREIMEKGALAFQSTYKQYPLVISHGEGSYVVDTDGKRYLDFGAGIAVSSLGHNHPRLTQAIVEQAHKFLHCSNLYWNQPAVELATLLVKKGDLQRVYFANSGTESNEAAIKLARKYSYLTYGMANPTDPTPSNAPKSELMPPATFTRTEIISMKNSFHGRSYGSLTLTGQQKYHKGFYPLLEGVKYGEFNNLQSVKELITEKSCAIIVEPVQGESGIHPATPEFLQGLRELADAHDLLLIFDEVQCGIGRLGTLFAYQHMGVTPDIVTLAKGLGGGLPIGAMICSERVNSFVPGDHAGTYCGNPLVTAGALAVLQEVSKAEFLSQVVSSGNTLVELLNQAQQKHPSMVEVRGVGLMQGVELSFPVAPLITKAMEAGLLLIPTGERVVRFVPPLTVTQEEIALGVEIFSKILSDLEE